jgi:hypothetical protein
MARIDRKNQKVFASNASNNGQFGSAQLGTKLLTNDVETIQALSAWVNGWNDATISGQRLPTLEELQAIQYVLTSQLAYLFQEGIAEWNEDTTYYQKSIVRKTGTYELYGSLTDDNVGNALSDAGEWVLLVDLANVGGVQNNFAATADPTVNDDAGDGYSQASIWYNTVSGEFFICVDASIGSAVWASTSPVSIIDSLGGLIESPENVDYVVMLKAPFAMTITETTTKSASGTCTMTFKINSTALGGTANSVSSSEQSQAHASANSVAAGDDIVITVSSNSNCVRASFTIAYTRAV